MVNDIERFHLVDAPEVAGWTWHGAHTPHGGDRGTTGPSSATEHHDQKE